MPTLPFSKTNYEKLQYTVFPTIRRRDKYGTTNTLNEITVGKSGDRDAIGKAVIVSKEQIKFENISPRFLMFDTNTDSYTEAVEALNSFYRKPIEPDEELTVYWSRWVDRYQTNGGQEP